MEKLASGFLHRDSTGVLSTAADELKILRHQTGVHTWGIRSPLKTKASRGYEQRGRQGQHDVRADLTSTWAIRNEDKKVLRIVGNVSTVVSLVDEADDSELGRWRAELGAKGAPGCFFHTQIRGQGQDNEPPWPHSVPVPRLPSPFVSIPSVLAFVLGELFQTEWAEHLEHERSETLAAYHRDMWARRLQWELSVTHEGGTLPWSRMKRALPPRDLFTARDVRTALDG